MKNLYLSIIITSLALSSVAQTESKKNNEQTYIRNENQVKGKRTVYTEIIINATPQVVRAKFLEFEKWPEWNAVIPKIAIKAGDINDLSTEPTLDLTLDFGRKNDPSQAPTFPIVTENNKEVFNWGFKMAILKAEHVFIFEPTNNDKGTRLVHYERMSGLLKSFVLTKKTKANMTVRYNAMNAALKTICE
jgi:hypothetical protein